MSCVRFSVLALLAAIGQPAAADQAAPAVQAEIVALISSVESSGCRFNRNGTWYEGSEAKAHLMTKLDYIEKRTTLETAEQFIELAASKSSVSGKPYLIQCGNGPEERSDAWLGKRLHALRGQ